MNSVSPVRYRILDRIGAGGMGVVYLARDLSLGREVALKLLPESHVDRSDRLARFRREARAAAALNHPGICTIYEVGEVAPGEAVILTSDATPLPPGTRYISMERIRGTTLRETIGGRPLPLNDVLRLGIEIADALSHAHRSGVVHRDLKPSNIMITEDRRAKILDFGLAKFDEDPSWFTTATEDGTASTTTADLTAHGVLLGTYAYMSPEQARGHNVDSRSDLFSFGAVLHEMLTGRPAFSGATRVDVLDAVLRDQPSRASESNPAIPALLEKIVEKCLEKEPSARYESGLSLSADLKRVQLSAGASQEATVSTLSAGPSIAARRGWVAGGLLTVGAAAALWSVLSGNPFRPKEPIPMAILPLAYEGPPGTTYLKDVVPLALADALRASSEIQIAPFGSSRSFGTGVEPSIVGRQLGVNWIVSGKIAVTGDEFAETIEVAGIGGGTQRCSRDMTGRVADVVSVSSALAKEVLACVGARAGSTKDAGVHRNPAAMDAYLRGLTLLEGWDVKSNAEQAEAAFREAIAADPAFAEAYSKLAVALLSRFTRTHEPSLIELATGAADKAISLDAALPEANVARGLVDLQHGKSAQAAASFEKALALAPADDALHRSIARAYGALGRDAEAGEMFQRAVNLRPEFWSNYNAWANFCMRRGNFEKAGELFRKVVELHPESDIGYTNLAAVYIQTGRHREAETLLQAALKINPSFQTYNNLGTVYYALGRFDEAARQWETAASTAKDAMVFSNLGDAYRQTHRTSDARSAYSQAIDLGRARLSANPADVDTRGMLANALAGNGECAAASSEGSRAVKDGAGNPSVAYYAAVASAICGDRKQAVAYTLRAIGGGVTADLKTNPDLAPILADPAIARALK